MVKSMSKAGVERAIKLVAEARSIIEGGQIPGIIVEAGDVVRLSEKFRILESDLEHRKYQIERRLKSADELRRAGL